MRMRGFAIIAMLLGDKPLPPQKIDNMKSKVMYRAVTGGSGGLSYLE
jgi:hypothetical protein